MSEEEKKAVEYLNDFKSIKIMYGNTFVMYLEQLKKYQQATDTALNIITRQQIRIEKLKHSLNIILSELPEDIHYKAIEKLLEE